MKRALQLFALTITSIILLSSASAFAVPGDIALIGGTPQALTVCQNSAATSINAFLTTSDDVSGETLTWSVFLLPSHGSLSGFNATATSILGNNTPSGLTYTPTPGFSGSDIIQVEVSNGTNSAYTQINITIQAAPTPSFSSSPGANVCTNTSVTYTTQSGGGLNSYSWSVPGTSGTDYTITSGGTGSTNSTVTLSWITTGSKTVTVNYSNLSGCQGITAASNTTTVNARPTVSFTSAPGASICGGVNTTYTTQSGQSSYVWSVPGTSGVDYNIVSGGIGSGSNTVTLNWITSGNKTVTVNYNNAAGCNGLSAASNTTNVLTRPVATFTTAPGANSCVGTGVTYTTQSGQSGYAWTVPGISGTDYTINSGGIGSGSNTVTLTWLTPATRTVEVNYSDANGCTSSSNATNTTTVNALPTPSFTSAPGALTCAGVNVTYTTEPGQSSYIWSVPGTSGTNYTITAGGIGTSSNTVTLFWITSGNKTVTVNYSNAGGCSGATAATTTTSVDAVVPTFSSSPSAAICAGSDVTYTTQTGGGINSYVWSVPGTSGTDYNITSGGTGSTNNTVTLNWVTAGNQTVTVNYSDANTCTGINPASNTTDVNARPVPTFTSAAGANSCVGSSVTYTTQSGQSSYIWSVPGVAGTDYTIVSGSIGGGSNTVTINWISTGNQTVTVNYTDVNGCTGASAASNTTNVNSIPTPSYTTAPGANTCAGSPVTYTTQTGATTYSWSVPGTATIDYNITAGSIGSGSNTVTINWLTGGSKTVTVNYTNVAGCSGTSAASNTTAVHAPTPTFTSVPASPACAGVNTTYTTQSGMASYAWSVPGTAGTDYTIISGGIGSGSNTVTLVWLTNGSKTVTVNYTDGFGCSAITPATNTASVNPSPSGITGPATVCTGSTIILSDVTSGGTWSSSNPALATAGSTTGIVTGYGVGSPNILYTLGNGCAASVAVTVNQTPTGISGTFSACEAGPTTTLTNGYSGGTWTSSSTGVATVGSTTGVVTPLAGGTTTITYTLPGGCTATVVFTVNALPAAIGGAGDVCVAGTTTLTDATSSGVWTSSATSVATIWSGSGLLTGIGAGTTTISYTLATGCFTTAPFTVNPNPAAITGSNFVCAGNSTLLADATGSGTWSSSNTAMATVIASGVGAGTASGVSAGVLTISYSITATGCYATTPFTVNPVPSAITGATSICQGLTTTLSDATGGGTWSSSATGVASINSTSGLVTGVSGGNATITYSLPTGCIAATAPSGFTVNPTPAAIGGTLANCPGTTTTLTDASGGGTWASNNTAVATMAGAVATGVSAGTTTITYTLPTGCFNTATLTVNSNPAAITGTASVCQGLTTTLSDATGGGTWSSGTPGNVAVVAASGLAVGVTGGTTATITYSLGTGCIATTSVTVNANPAGLTFSPGTGIISLVGGTGGTGFSGDNGPATSAQVGWPLGVTTDLSNNIYISDNLNNRVRKISATGTITTFAGTGAGGSGGDGGPATAATFSGDLWQVVADNSGNVYIADASGGKIRKVNASGIISTFAGGGSTLGDNGPATAAQLQYPSGLAVDALGNIYIADNGTSRIRKVNTFGIITTVAGTGTGGFSGDGGQATAAKINSPYSVAVDGAGTIYIGDEGNARIRKVTTAGVISTICGNGTFSYSGEGIAATAASIGDIYSISADNNGNVYIPEYDYQRIRKINSAGIIATIAGNGTYAYSVDGGLATTAELASPIAITTDQQGNLIEVEYDGSRVRKIIPTSVCPSSTITLADVSGGGTWASSNTTFATVSGGTVSGVSTGNPVISYTLSDGCASTVSTTVTALPATISGANNVCVGSTDALSDVSGGGLWTSSNTGLATIGSTTGVANGVSNGSLNIIYTLPTGCVATLPFSVNPTPPAISGATSVCTGLTTTLTDATGGGTWSSSNPAVGTVSTSGVVTGISAGALTISYTTSPGSCFAVKAFTVYATPSANTGTATVCTGQTTTLANSTSGGTWSATGSAATVGGTGVVTGISAGTSVISYLLTTGCYANTTVTVSLSPAAITGASSVCTGASTTLSSTTGGGTWSSSNTALATVSGATVTGVAAGTLTITYTVGSCFVTYPFAVNQTPPAIVGGNQVCIGLPDALSDGIGGGTWSSSNTSLATVGTSGIVSGSTAGSLNIIYTLSGGCTATLPITVNTQPAAIAGTHIICTGTTTVLTDATVGDTWSSSASTVASVTSGTVTAVSAGTATISYTGAGGCNVVFPMTINQTPAAITGTAVVCVGSTTLLSDTYAGGSWTSSNSLQGSVGVATGLVAGVAAGTPTITYTLPGGCYALKPITVNALPTVYAVTGGGAYCSGASGSHIGLTNGDAGVSYQLYIGSATSGSQVTGTGIPIDFGARTAAGTYTVVATNTTTGCTNSMSGSAVITINPLPFAYTVTGGGSYCSGTSSTIHVGLSGSAAFGVTYQLENGGPVGAALPGTGVILDYGIESVAGTYTVVATITATGCTSTMNGSATITVNAAPTLHTVTTPGGTSYCAGGTGVHIGLNTSDIGFSYQLYFGGGTSGSPLAGTGASLDFGLVTNAGTYTVLATNTTTGCNALMTGSPAITINPLPTVYGVTAPAGAGYCSGGSGINIVLTGSSSSAIYQLLLGGVATGSPVTGSGTAFTIGTGTVNGGVYTVRATSISGSCATLMSGNVTVTVNPLPTAYSLTTPLGTTYCAGGAGVHVGLSSSQIGVTYQLSNGSGIISGAVVSGTGAAIDFGVWPAGTYTVQATNVTTTCTNTMSGSAVVVANPLPSLYTMSASGAFCIGGTGWDVKLNGSNTGFTYQLYRGATPVGTPLNGTGGILDYGLQTIGGTYTVQATNTTTSCAVFMTGSTIVTVNPLPVAYNVTGGGSFCLGGTGVAVGLSGSVTGVNYQLYNGSGTVGGTTAGTNVALNFGLKTVPSTYYVVATSTAGCVNNMTGAVVITANALPVAYTVTGGGAYCIGGTGAHVGLGNSDIGVNYELYNLGTPSVGPLTGTAAPLDFGLITAVGTYSVVATSSITTCTNNMTGTVVVTTNPLPLPFTVGGGGSYCAGGTGMNITLSGSVSGTNYQVYRGTVAVGSPVAGSGAGILSLGLQTVAGTYTVVATNTATGCTSNMTGSAAIAINPAPNDYTVTGGGGYCAGGTGVNVGLSGSSSGISYQLYKGGVSVGGSPVIGSGAPFNYALETAVGTYTIVATNTVTTCTANMLSSAVVSINTPPAAFTVATSGTGHYCSGGTGVNITLSNSSIGVNYQLMYGGIPTGTPIVGTSLGISFGLQTSAGAYTVQATNATTGCTAIMTGTATVVVDPLPAPNVVTGGGSYCPGGTGVNIGLLSSVIGTTYQVSLAGAPVGGPVNGIGTALTLTTVTTPGVYTVTALLPTGCSSTMPGSATVAIYSLPTTYSVSGGGSYCAGGTGLAVDLTGSDIGTNYQLYNDDTLIGGIYSGTGAAINFGLQTAGGSYMVVATSTLTSCVDTMYDSTAIVVNALPIAQAVTGGGSYCPGSTGVNIGIGSSESGVNYQLYNGGVATGSPVPGTTLGIDFGLYTATGIYTIVGTNTTTMCASNMAGSDTISVYPAPTLYNVTGGGSYCAGGTGTIVGLSNSSANVVYQLYNGTTMVGAVDTGNGAALNFGLQTATGIYTVSAMNYVTGCSANMAGSASITTNPLPFAYNVTGGGGYCVGGTGVHIGLSGSNIGVSYQLMDSTALVGSGVLGTGLALDFGLHTAAGNYKVVATNPTTTCMSNMMDSVMVNINPLPTLYSVFGSSTSYCVGGVGVTIFISGTDLGVNYQLYRGTTPIGISLAGTGTTALDFGPQTVPGIYTVVATNTSTGCTRTMTGSATFSINPLPPATTVTGGGGYCAGGAGAVVGLASSNTGVSYQLYNSGIATGIPLNGTGGPVTFGMESAAGTYTVVATNVATGCTNNMISSATVVVNPLPTVYTVGGGGSYCAGGTGADITLSGSVTGINYQLNYAGAPFGGVVPGTGIALTFGPETTAGTYLVTAMNTATGCANTMAGTSTIAVNSLPAAFTVTGGGNYCPGGAGVSVGLYGSATGIRYQLYNGTTATGSPMYGTGLPIDFGIQAAIGTYSIMATDTAAGCSMNMTGSVSVGHYALPVVYNVTGGGSYCAGGTGVNIGVDGSNSGVSYQLLFGGSPIGVAAYGTGAAVSFGNDTLAGTYTVVATNTATTCADTMAGSVAVAINPLVTPAVSIVTTMGDTACNGVAANFTASAVNGGASPAYVWMVNGLSFGTGNTFSYTPAAGDVVSVMLTSNAVCATPDTASSMIALIVVPVETPNVVVAAVPGDVVCRGTMATFTATAFSGGLAPTYTWKKNGMIVGTNSPLYSVTPDNGDVVTCLLTSSYQCSLANSVLSNAITMEVDTPVMPMATISVSPLNYIVKGETATFTATLSNTVIAPTYQWYVNNHFVPGATLPVYSDNVFTDLEVVKCIVTSGGGCGGTNDTTNSITLHVSTVGVQQLQSGTADVQLVPNPNNGIFTLKGTLGTTLDQEVTVEITNMLGQVIYNSKVMVANGAIDAKIHLDSNPANGMYILNLHTGTENKVFHMVIEQ